MITAIGGCNLLKIFRGLGLPEVWMVLARLFASLLPSFLIHIILCSSVYIEFQTFSISGGFCWVKQKLVIRNPKAGYERTD